MIKSFFSKIKFIFIPFVYGALNHLNYALYPIFNAGKKGNFIDPNVLFLLTVGFIIFAGFIFSKIIFPLMRKFFMIQAGVFMTLIALKSAKFELNKQSIGGIVFAWILVAVYFSMKNTKITDFLMKITGLTYLGNKFKKLFRKKQINCAVDLSMNQINAFGNGNTHQKGRVFEEYIAELYRTLGYNAQTTTSLREQGRLPPSIQKRGGSGEQGVDVIVEYINPQNKERSLMAIQCKHYSNKVGNSAVQEINTALPLYNARMGVVITNNYYTKQAQELAAANGVLLIDRNGLEKMIENAVNAFEKRQKAA